MVAEVEDRRLKDDYEAAKKALGALWDSLAKETYTRFSSLTEDVEKRFRESREKIKEADVYEVLNKAGGKIEKLAGSASEEARKLAKQVKLLYMMLRDSVSGKFKAPWVTISSLTACLLYVISPIDLVPDFVAGLGLVDDLLVVALCVSLVKMDLRRYAEEMKLNLADYGL